MTQQKGVLLQTPVDWLGSQFASVALARGHDNPSVRCGQPGVQPLPPAALKLLWLGMDWPCAKCLCMELQHIMPPQIMQFIVQ